MSSAIAREVVLTLNRNLHRLDFPDVPPAAIEHVKTMLTLAKEIATLVQPAPKGKLLEGRALWESLAHAIVGIARAKRSARLTAKDLKDLVEDYSPEPHMAFWAEQPAGGIVGLLRYEAQVRKLTDPSVLFFEMWEDSQWRIVDTHWLEAHADIRRWVTKEWAGGRRCRFCGCSENPHVNALLPVNVERRNGVSMIGNTVVLQTGGALTHDACRRFWIEWCSIAAKYPSQEAAEQADALAGRKSRREKVAQAAVLEAPAHG